MATKKTGRTAAAPATPELPTLDDLSKWAERFKLPGVDVNALVDWQRRDLEALAEAHREAFDGFKALVERRNEMLSETLSRWQESAKEASGEDFAARQQQAVKLGMQQAMENFRELSAMEAESRGKAWKLVQDRLQENLVNLQKLLPPK